MAEGILPQSLINEMTITNNVTMATTVAPNATVQDGFYFYQEEQLTFLYILFILIVTGNSLVIIAILSSRTRKSRMHIFILNLAFADLSAGLVNVLTDIVWKNTVDWHGGNVVCKVVRYGQGVVTYGSTYALVALSIDRLNAIARPMSFSNDKFRTRFLIGMAWLLSLIFSVPMLVINEEQDHGGGPQCGIEFPHVWNWKLYITTIAVVVFFIPAVIIAVCYIIIVVIIWRKTSSGSITSATSSAATTTTTTTTTTKKSSKFVKSGAQLYVANNNSHFREGSASSRGVIPRAKMKTIKMTLVIVLVFIICWSPYFVFDILAVYGLSANNRHYVAISTFMQSLAPLNSAANPLIYAIFNYNTCYRLFRCKRKYTNSSTMSHTHQIHAGNRRNVCDR